MMDLMSISIALAVLLVFSFFHVFLTTLSRKRTRLPPGPAPLPIIGNLHLFAAGKLNTNLTNLHKTYGPMVYLQLGGLPTVVVSSPSAAKEILQKQESAFSSRFIPDVIYHTDVPQHSVVWLPSNTDQWRSLRKIMVSNIFTNTSLEASQYLRYKKVQELIDYCRKSSDTGQAVEIGQAVFSTMVNLMSNTIFSKDLADYYSESAKELKDTVQNSLVEAITLNVVDMFPVLREIDRQGFRHRPPVHFSKISKLFNGLVDERLEKRRLHGASNDDVLDGFLNYSEEHPDEIEINHIRQLCMDIFTGGVDTTGNTIEWAMAEVLKNPEVMKKAKDELAQVIGKGKPIINEADVARLPYLQCILKETIRLHRFGIFLFPRKAEQDVEVCGYNIPKDSVVLINIWELGHDSNLWEDPLVFKPERFQELDTDFRGQNFELISFGGGKRSCPGYPLAIKLVPLILGSMINLFDWKLEGDIALEELNLEAKCDLAIHIAHPLRAIPISL